MDATDVSKKQRRLDAEQSAENVQPESRERAQELAAGNPRLLEWLDRVLKDEEVDSTKVFDALQQQAAEFREQTLLQQLLDQQSPECRRLLALLSVCRLPVDRDAVTAITGFDELEPHLTKAARLGLLEAGTIRAADPPHYHVSAILGPLLEAEIDAAARQAASHRAARHLFAQWWESTDQPEWDRALEVHRLGLECAECGVAVPIATALSNRLLGRVRFAEARDLAKTTLAVCEDYRVLHSLARAEEVLGETGEALAHFERARELCPTIGDNTPESVIKEYSAILHNLAGLLRTLGDVPRALELWQQSLDIEEQIGDVQGKAATLHNMAGVIAQQGDVPRALELWQQSLELKEQIGDVRGKAATLHNMAGVIAQQGDVPRALELWQQSLALQEQIGNVQGKAATLANMAWAAGQTGDKARKIELNREAARILGGVRAWPDLVTVLRNLGSEESPESVQYLAQAVWLLYRVHVPVSSAVPLAAAFVRRVGLEQTAALPVAGLAAFLAATRGSDHPKQEEFQKLAASMLGACAEAAGVVEADLTKWTESSKVVDIDEQRSRFDAVVDELVPADAWLFERGLVEK
ncbi:MAG: tetratricopeptide repeat protein [Planctomycetaceae bacterium]|nr:tetratricopeptide repeat protein [Planctomycetaceae bacterium]